MTVSYKVAITAATIFSAVSLYDAAHHGVTGRGSALSDEYGMTWATIAASIVSSLSFIALAVILVIERVRIDGDSRLRRWVRRLLAVDLALLAAVFGIGVPLMAALGRGLDGAVGGVAGVAFAAMFLLAVGLGLSLIRIREFRPSAVLLLAVVPAALGLTIILQATGSGFAHPAYAETAVYLGIALLGRRPQTGVAAPDESRSAATQAQTKSH